jgi:Domain of unknown function (DUF4129)
VAEDRQPERREPPGPGAADRRRGPRAVLPALAAAALLALVAVGSLRGPLGSGRGRPSYPADLVDSLLLLLFLAMVAAGLLAGVVLWPDRHLVSRRRRPAGALGMLLPLAAVLALWLFRDLLGLGGFTERDPPTSTHAPPSTLEIPEAPASPGVVPLVVAGVAAAAMVTIVVAQLAADRRRRRPPPTPAERLVELLDDTLEDLEREPDPRRAVIGAWARMERGLAAAGLPRQPAEAPFEYAARVLESALGVELGQAGLRPTSVHRLTQLFERAKFSHHRIDLADRDEAVAALRAVRRELADAVELSAQTGQARALGDRAAGSGPGR